MKEYFFLFSGIAFEVLGTFLLPFSQNFTKLIPSVVVILSYIISLYFLTISLEKLPLPVVYSSWAALGVFSIAILSYFFYGYSLTWQSVLGLLMIVVGVTIVNIYQMG